MGARAARGFSLFMNWFNGILAPVCGILMMSGLWDGIIPLYIFDRFPFHDVFFTSLFWPGLALLLVNGVANIVALVFRFCGKKAVSYRWGIIAGILLVLWTGFEMIYMPNPVSVLYLVLGMLQIIAGAVAFRNA